MKFQIERGHLCGGLLALFHVSGRWSPSRVFSIEETILVHPRLWFAGVLFFLMLLPGRRHEPARRQGAPGLLLFGVLLGGFYAWTLFAAGWSPDLFLAKQKAIEIGVLVLVFISLARAARRERWQAIIDGFWFVMLGVLGMFAALAMLGALAGSGRVSVLGGGPNVFGRNMGLLGIAALMRALKGKLGGVWLGVFAVATILMLLSGSRGAMIATGAAAMMALAARQENRSRALVFFVGLVVVLFAFFLLTGVGARALEMFQLRFVKGLYEARYVSGRDEIYRGAWRLGLEFPLFGAGLAAYPAYSSWPYPHNMFLESFCETGIIGFGLQLGAILAWLGVLFARGRATIDAAAAGAVLFVVASQFSGDIYDTRGAYILMFISLLHSARMKFGDEPERT